MSVSKLTGFMAASAILGSSAAFAGTVANDVFVANAERGTVVGTSTITGESCGFVMRTSEWNGELVGSMNYNFHADEGMINSFSPGHFSKNLFKRRLVHGGPGLIETVISGHTIKSLFEIDYDANLNITAMRRFWDKKLEDECIFQALGTEGA